MKFKDVLLAIDLVVQSDGVPLIIGESGIGKTSLIKKYCEYKNYFNITIDGNILKEGEIGGLPTILDYTYNINGKDIIKKKTVYAAHTKLIEIEDILKENPNSIVLLFIDELNRCEHTVQQELMNIILNREINGYKLPERVKIVAAMNPSSKYNSFKSNNNEFSNYENNDYQVVDLDPAQENRFVWLELEADYNSWIKWGSTNSYIHEKILEFISTYPQYLNTPSSTEIIKATPRSWERVSNSYKIYIKNSDSIPKTVFYNVVKGNVGITIGQQFMNFIEDNNILSIKAEDLFKNNTLTNELIDKIKNESPTRLYLLSKNSISFLQTIFENESNGNILETYVAIFSESLQLFPPDLKISVMRELKENNSIYSLFLNNSTFIQGYFDTYNQLE